MRAQLLVALLLITLLAGLVEAAGYITVIGTKTNPTTFDGYIVDVSGAELSIALYTDSVVPSSAILEGYLLVPCRYSCDVDSAISKYLRTGAVLPKEVFQVQTADGGSIYVIPVYAGIYRVSPGSVVGDTTLTIISPGGESDTFTFPVEQRFSTQFPYYTATFKLTSTEPYNGMPVHLKLDYSIGTKFSDYLNAENYIYYVYIGKNGVAYLANRMESCTPDYRDMFNEINSIFAVEGDCGQYCYPTPRYTFISGDPNSYHFNTHGGYYSTPLTLSEVADRPVFIESSLCTKPDTYQEDVYYVSDRLIVRYTDPGAVLPEKYTASFVPSTTKEETLEANEVTTTTEGCDINNIRIASTGWKKVLRDRHFITDEDIKEDVLFYAFCGVDKLGVSVESRIGEKVKTYYDEVKLRKVNEIIRMGEAEFIPLLSPYSSVLNKVYLCVEGECKYAGEYVLSLPDDWFCYNNAYYDVQKHKVTYCREGCVEGGCKEMVEIKELAREASEGNIPAYLKFLRGDIGDVLTYGLLGSIIAILGELPSVLKALPMIPGGLATVFLVTFGVIALAFKIVETCVKPEYKSIVHEMMWFAIALFGDVGAITLAVGACLYSRLKG